MKTQQQIIEKLSDLNHDKEFFEGAYFGADEAQKPTCIDLIVAVKKEIAILEWVLDEWMDEKPMTKEEDIESRR